MYTFYEIYHFFNKVILIKNFFSTNANFDSFFVTSKVNKKQTLYF